VTPAGQVVEAVARPAASRRRPSRGSAAALRGKSWSRRRVPRFVGIIGGGAFCVRHRQRVAFVGGRGGLVVSGGLRFVLVNLSSHNHATHKVHNGEWTGSYFRERIDNKPIINNMTAYRG